MADIGKAYVQIIPKAEGISGKIGNLISPGAKDAGKNAGADSGKGFGEGLKKAVAGLAIGATLTAGMKAALDEGGKLQQSYGGLETIYGDAAAAAKEYAAEAAKAGISANDYAENAVSFGASLKQAFEGDTAKAVEAANTAILDMTDNAAKMGTPIENIQNAYQGFAKQNYTMLDNLKLGYGGTKSEMERLLADAQKISGVEYNIDNLGDVYDAIHVIQGELGLTGVAAQEASETFSGSFGAMQAAGKNLLGNLALGENVAPAMTEFVSSVGTFLFKNLFPMIGTVMSSLPGAIGSAITTAAPAIAEAAPGMIQSLITGITTAIPTIVSKAQGIITGIRQGIVTYLPMLANVAGNAIRQLASWFTANLPTIIDTGKNLLTNLIDGVVSMLPQLASTAGNIITSIAGFLAANLPTIGQKGGELLGELAKSIISAIPTVVSAIAHLIPVIGRALLKLVPVALKAVKSMIAGLVSGIAAGWGNIRPAVSNLIQNIQNKLKEIVNKGKQIMKNLMSAMAGVWDNIKSKAGTAFDSIKSKITKPIENAKNTIKSAMDKIKGFFPISIGNIFSSLKLPHFKVSGGEAPWGFGGKGSLPHVSVDWYAKGGVFDDPSIIGVGEAGREAVIPLSGSAMRPFADAVASAMNGAGNTYNYNVNINVDGTENPEDYAARLARQLRQELRMA